MRKITKKQLEKLFFRLIKKLEYEDVNEIEFDSDLYRFIPTDKWSTYEHDVILEGSLFDDIDSLGLLLKNSDRACSYVDFDRVASLLRAISEKLAPTGD